MQRTNLTLQAGESKPPLPRHYVSTRPPTVSLESFTTLANVGEQGPRKYSQYMPGRRMSENSGTARRPWRISFHDKRLSRRHYLPPQLSRAVSSKIKKKSLKFVSCMNYWCSFMLHYNNRTRTGGLYACHTGMLHSP